MLISSYRKLIKISENNTIDFANKKKDIMDEWINKTWHIHTLMYYLAFKRREFYMLHNDET